MGIKQKKTYSAEERRRKNRRFNTVLYIISAVLILGGIAIIISDTTYLFDKIFRPGKFVVEVTVPPGTPVLITPSPSPLPGESVEPVVTAEPVASRPVKVVFPQYSIVCPVDPVGFNWKGQMATVRAHDRAGWLETSGTPATGGNILIAGHNKYSGKLGYFDVVKSKLQVGDIVYLELENGEIAYYVVESVNKWRYDEVPNEVMQIWGEPRLTLITCYGDFSHEIGSSIHRVIAICKPVTFQIPETSAAD